MAALAANDDHNATPEWDFRGKLFLSSNAPYNGYWTRTGAGRNARLAGKIQTDTTDKDDGGPFFRRELDISIISNRASFIQAFREVSDFIVVFEGPEQLSLRKLDGSYGQIFVPNGLQYLGFDHDIYLDDFWIVWSESEENRVVLQSTDLGPDQTYYMYFLGNIDPFNFKEENPNTRRPWQETDVGAEDSYDPDLDLRLKPVISSKVPDHGRMAEVWPGFYTRWIGIVRTDGLGNFMETRDLSQIRQPTLTPITFDGVAEIQFKTQSNNTMLIIRRA